jgi:peptide/nickel transport system ATP-binding protein/oligopeptide transport system ATP-binding protein
VLSIRGLQVSYPARSGGSAPWRRVPRLAAVAGVDLDVMPGETLGLVGESGSGKSSLLMAVLGLVEPDAGTVALGSRTLAPRLGRRTEQDRRALGVVFQDPMAALTPTCRVGDAIGEIVGIHTGLRGQARTRRVHELLESVQLPSRLAARRPGELSGGQRQRVTIARALAPGPRVLLLDEPVTSLDVATQGQVLALLGDLQDRLGVAYVLVGHDIRVVRRVSDRIAVVYRGRVVEQGPADRVHDAPHHPYTRRLVAAVPVADPAEMHRRRAAGGATRSGR